MASRYVRKHGGRGPPPRTARARHHECSPSPLVHSASLLSTNPALQWNVDEALEVVAVDIEGLAAARAAIKAKRIKALLLKITVALIIVGIVVAVFQLGYVDKVLGRVVANITEGGENNTVRANATEDLGGDAAGDAATQGAGAASGGEPDPMTQGEL